MYSNYSKIMASRRGVMKKKVQEKVRPTYLGGIEISSKSTTWAHLVKFEEAGEVELYFDYGLSEPRRELMRLNNLQTRWLLANIEEVQGSVIANDNRVFDRQASHEMAIKITTIVNRDRNILTQTWAAMTLLDLHDCKNGGQGNVPPISMNKQGVQKLAELLQGRWAANKV